MIKFLATKNDDTVIGLGLSRANCLALLAGEEVELDAGEMHADLAHIRLYLFGGETDQTMREKLDKQGMLVGVPIKTDPNLI